MATDAGSYRNLALGTIMIATVGVAFALLITAVELSKDEAQPVYDLNLRRGSPEYRLFLAVRASLVSALKCASLPSCFDQLPLNSCQASAQGEARGCRVLSITGSHVQKNKHTYSRSKMSCAPASSVLVCEVV